jgi:pimeloyl-ACP methyl ester carboxylesterase
MTGRGEEIRVRGIAVAMQRGGRGEPLLYLHSASAESSLWGPAFESLSDHYEVVAPVHPGFPGSGGLERMHGIGDLVLHYVDLLDRLDLRRVHVVGSSLGGWIAVELASLYRERVGALVLADAAGLWLDEAPMREVFGIPPGELAERLFRDQRHPMAQMLHAAGETSWAEPPPDDVLLAFHQSTEATARIAWNPYFHDPALPGRLDRVSAPTLVLWGAEDRLIPLAHGERYRDSIRGATLKTIPRCGHLPVIERPEEFAREVTAFLRAHPLPGAPAPEAA